MKSVEPLAITWRAPKKRTPLHSAMPNRKRPRSESARLFALAIANEHRWCEDRAGHQNCYAGRITWRRRLGLRRKGYRGQARDWQRRRPATKRGGDENN